MANKSMTLSSQSPMSTANVTDGNAIVAAGDSYFEFDDSDSIAEQIIRLRRIEAKIMRYYNGISTD